MSSFDFSIPVPATTYIIASTMRTGSYLLCEGLEETGRAGHPKEIFCPERREDYAGEWQLPLGVGLGDFLCEAIQNSTTENGVCGIKIHGHHVEPLARECGVTDEPWQVLRKLFPNAKYIHLRRLNQREQAISYYRAMTTNEWWRIPGVPGLGLPDKKLKFNAGEIRRLEIELERQQNAWDKFLAGLPGKVIAMDYEGLAASYRGEIARALAFIGEDPALAQKIPEPRLSSQYDCITEEWHYRMNEAFPR